MNNGFAFYQNYWEAIQSLPIDQQKEVCYAIVCYGITGEMVNPASFPIGYAMTQGFKPAIDNSVDRWNNNVAKAERKALNAADRDAVISDLIQQGMNSVEIAEELGMQPSTVRKTRAWRSRINHSFEAKRENVHAEIEENVKNSRENSREESVKNVKISREKRENSREIHVPLDDF